MRPTSIVSIIAAAALAATTLPSSARAGGLLANPRTGSRLQPKAGSSLPRPKQGPAGRTGPSGKSSPAPKIDLPAPPRPGLVTPPAPGLPRPIEDARPAVLVGHGPRAVIVELDASPIRARFDRLRKRRGLRHDDARIRKLKRLRYRALADALARRLSPLGLSVSIRFQNVPAVAVRIAGDADLSAIERLPGVAAVHENLVFEPTLAESLPLIGQPAAQAAGAVGAGRTVAILDTGIDFRRAAFGSCTAPGRNGCRVVAAREFAEPDGARDDNGHGTNVAGIVAGVAPGVRLLSLDVFNQVPGSSRPLADTIAIARAIDFTIQTQARFNTVAMNLSLGISGVGSRGRCLTPIDVFFGEAQAAGIMPIVASGNDGDPERVSIPACSPFAVSVGRVDDDDTVNGTSNSSRALDLLAPGTAITAAGLTLSGTSMAAPHVAGAWAVLAAARADLSLGQILQALRDTGMPVVDARQGRVTPRIRIDAALEWQGPAVANPGLINLGDVAPIESAWVDCQMQEVTDGVVCGWQTVTDLVTDAAVCGVETITSAVECGVETVTNAAICGVELVQGSFEALAELITSGEFPCGCDLSGCTCELPASCQVPATCDVPASCQIERSCDPEAELCDPESCEIQVCEL